MSFKIKLSLIVCAVTATILMVAAHSGPAFALYSKMCPDGKSYAEASNEAAHARICASRAQNNAKGPAGNFKGDCDKDVLDSGNCSIVRYVLIITNILSALVGIVVVIMIAIGGLQYAASRDNPQATVNAKNRLKTAVLALVGYLFVYAFLQYIIPGGIL